ncbi:hypothetical protein OIE68_08945 [Nocardia vinacea]|uniref:hypothetical protein n=1 Tax=Nocardia vinacea TaxID=96468 RepID=UPI002E14FCAF|nr:hypothetical protein OIE68_08945 [Nocardia vinacea]
MPEFVDEGDEWPSKMAPARPRDQGAVSTLSAFGAGAYEPTDRVVTPVEPSASMRDQRPSHLAPAIDASAEQLPFPDASLDAAVTIFSGINR